MFLSYTPTPTAALTTLSLHVSYIPDFAIDELNTPFEKANPGCDLHNISSVKGQDDRKLFSLTHFFKGHDACPRIHTPLDERRDLCL